VANKVVTQPRCTMTLHVYEVKHSVPHSHPPHFKCSVASCAQVLWCCSEQMFKKSSHHREFYWTFHSRSLKGAETTLAPGRLCMCCVNLSILVHFFSFLLLFTKANDLRILCLLNYQLLAQYGLAQRRGGLKSITP